MNFVTGCLVILFFSLINLEFGSAYDGSVFSKRGGDLTSALQSRVKVTSVIYCNSKVGSFI